MSADLETTFGFFDDPRNLGRLMPPPVRVRLVRAEPAPVDAGTRLEFRYGIGPWQRTWLVEVLEHEPPHRFVDRTISGPLPVFHHTHAFRAGTRGTWVSDRVEFDVGLAGLAGRLANALAGAVLRAGFVWRAAVQRRLLRDAAQEA